jgi:hypothetical protein
MDGVGFRRMTEPQLELLRRNDRVDQRSGATFMKPQLVHYHLSVKIRLA